MLDIDCAICCYLNEAINNLIRITELIEFSCSGQKKKNDFGLDKSFVMKEISMIQQMIKYHNYHHSTGEALNDSDSVIDLLESPKPKRFRKSN